jgi:hypothetical protein
MSRATSIRFESSITGYAELVGTKFWLDDRIKYGCPISPTSGKQAGFTYAMYSLFSYEMVGWSRGGRTAQDIMLDALRMIKFQASANLWRNFPFR